MDTTNKSIRLGVVAGILLTLYNLLLILFWDKNFDDVQGSVLFALIYGFMAWGIYKKSKGISILGIGFYIWDKVSWWRVRVDGISLQPEYYLDLIIHIIFLSALIIAAYGTISYHKHIQHQNSEVIKMSR